MIKIVEGDLLQATEDIIAHQTNCQGKMRSGVADQIAKKYPLVLREYEKLVSQFQVGEDTRRMLLGEVQGVETDDGKIIANLFGQLHYGYDGKQYTSPNALFKCFRTVRKTAERKGLTVAMPYMIGCFRGGADWKEVESLLLKAFEGYEVTLYKYDKG